MTDKEKQAWSEYDSAAEYLAKRGLTGKEGDPLPEGLSAATFNLINEDPDAFQERVRECGYARAMNRHSDQEGAASSTCAGPCRVRLSASR